MRAAIVVVVVVVDEWTFQNLFCIRRNRQTQEYTTWVLLSFLGVGRKWRNCWVHFNLHCEKEAGVFCCLWNQRELRTMYCPNNDIKLNVVKLDFFYFLFFVFKCSPIFYLIFLPFFYWRRRKNKQTIKQINIKTQLKHSRILFLSWNRLFNFLSRFCFMHIGYILMQFMNWK